MSPRHWLPLLFASLLFTLSVPLALVGQDEPKKEETKKDDEPKKEEKKVVKPPENLNPSWVKVANVRLKKVEPDDVGIEGIDQQKLLAFQKWYQQQQMAIARANFQQKQQAYKNFQDQLPNQQKSIYGGPLTLYKCSEKLKVRSAIPPVEYDDKGNLKKYTKTELAAMKGTGTMPGYAADFSALKEGQLVDIYLAKAVAKTAAPKKKDDEAVGGGYKGEAMLIVILGEGAK